MTRDVASAERTDMLRLLPTDVGGHRPGKGAGLFPERVMTRLPVVQESPRRTLRSVDLGLLGGMHASLPASLVAEGSLS